MSGAEFGELMGTRARVTVTGHAGFLGLEGRVVDETMRTFTLEVAGGEVVVPKQGQTFAFTLPDGSLATLDGAALAHRPEDRTRKARPRSPRRATTT